MTFDVHAIRQDFPGLQTHVHGQPLVYLDNGATTQKPRVVIESLQHTYTHVCANIHRGVHALSARATTAFEEARIKVQHFIHATSWQEIIFTRGTTESINLVAQTYGRQYVHANDIVLISAMEHHANIVPWQMLCAERGAILKVIPMLQDGTLCLASYAKLLTNNPKIVAIPHVSNVLGTVNPIQEMIRMAHAQGAVVLIDGAQALPHMRVNMQDINADFYAFSAHKIFGPTGVGVLYGKKALLDAMPPYQGGGDMIATVNFDRTTYNDVPYKFEAGTPDIAGVIALGVGVDYLQHIQNDDMHAYETYLFQYATDELSSMKHIKLFGHAPHKIAALSFTMDGIHPHDIGTIVDKSGVAIRTGHHCAQPIMTFYGVPAMARASLAFYNTTEEIDMLIQALHHVERVFQHG